MGSANEDNTRRGLSALSTHLRDLNVFDKQKLPPVIHGRKASTYLRIFQDDEHTHNREPQGAVTKPEDARAEPVIWKMPFHQTKTLLHGHVHEPRLSLGRRHSFSSSDVHHKSRRGSLKERNAQPLHGYRPPRLPKKAQVGSGSQRYPLHSAEGLQLHHESDTIPEGACPQLAQAQQRPHALAENSETGEVDSQGNKAKTLALKPISSATYYPHQTHNELADGTAPVTLAHSAPSVPQRTPLKTHQSQPGVPQTTRKIESRQQGSKSEDESEHDEEEVYPLAVELQPFNNKVGGHTAIFRFSERAVCKALVSRENMWYENIEQQHKELLQFIPRYIGVLNVRQHFNSKEEFLQEVEREKKAKIIKKQQKMDSLSVDGPSQKETRCATPPLAMKNPEVVLDDNKHIIPDSLWYKYSHSPESAPSDSFLSSHSMEDRSSRGWDSGSTVVNTKLQELVLKEVFAPTKRCAHARVSSLGERQLPQGSVSSNNLTSFNNDRRNSEELKQSDSTSPSSPMLNKSAKVSIANAIDSHSSVLDLKQFNERKLAQIDAETKTLSQQKPDETLRSSSPFHKFAEGQTDDEGVFTMEEDCPRTKEEPPNESVLFEENSHTIVSKFILLEDLTRKLDKPCVLDLKMGTRQYGVSANKFKRLSQSKKCRQTTSRKLGVRICGLKIWSKDYYIKRDKYFGRRVKIGWQFARVLARFLYNGEQISSIVSQIPRVISQLDKLYAEISKLKGYRLYGSSLLLIYDGNGSSSKKCEVKVNLIDFAQCVTSDDVATSWDSFRIPPKSPKTEDRGFLRGVRSLKFYLQSLWNYLTGDSPLLFDDALNEYIQCNKESFEKPWDWLDNFDQESEFEFDDAESELRKKWRKYELIFDVEPRYMDDAEISE